MTEDRSWHESGQEALEKRALPGAVERPRTAASFRLGVRGLCASLSAREAAARQLQRKYNLEPKNAGACLARPLLATELLVRDSATLRWEGSRWGIDPVLGRVACSSPMQPI